MSIDNKIAIGSGQRAAEEIVFTAFINSYIREFPCHSLFNTIPRHDPPLAAYMKSLPGKKWIKLELLKTGIEIYCPLKYYSLTGRHLFGFPVVYLSIPGRKVTEMDVYKFAELIILEIEAQQNELSAVLKENTFHYRLKDTVRNLSIILNRKSLMNEGPENSSALFSSFITSEQALLLGHSMHPLAKNRLGFTEDDFFNYSPEFGNGFQVFYFLAHPDIVKEDSVLDKPLSVILREELYADPALSTFSKEQIAKRPDYKLVPVHPWQAMYMVRNPSVKDWIKEGLLLELGTEGKFFSATASVRTVYNAAADFMFKFSLNVQVTNAERINLPKELYAGTDITRLFNSGWGQELRQEFPDFIFITDPAFITLHKDGEILNGFSTLLRYNPFHTGNENVTLAASLCQDEVLHIPNRLSVIIKTYALQQGVSTSEASARWFTKYLNVLLDPLIRMYNKYGLTIEAHQQNIMVGLDDHGFPEKIYFRDNQGYFIRKSYKEIVEHCVPGFGEKSGCVIPDESIPAKYVYYLLVNNILGFVNILGQCGLTGEMDLIVLLHTRLKQLEPLDESGLVNYMLSARDWEVKANLRMRLEDLNEDRMPVERPAVFVNYSNPLLLVEHFSTEVIYPDPERIIFNKYFETRKYELSLRGFNFEKDFEVIYDWVNREYAKKYWQMSGTRQYLESFYIKNTASDFSSTFIGLLNGEHAFLIEPYWPMREPVGLYYDAWKGDYGFHIMMKPPDGSTTSLLINAFRAALEYLFTLPKVQRVIGEADSRNSRLDALTRFVGYRLDRIIAMPEKNANLTICTRESYGTLFPETKEAVFKNADVLETV